MDGVRSRTVPAVGAGTLIAGKYRLDELLGRGGMGEVWRATHLDLDRRVALKLMHDAADEVAVARFMREAKAAAKVRHRNVVEVLDFGRTAEGDPFLVMEYLEGNSLEDRLFASPPPTIGEVGEWVAGSLSGLAAIHDEGIVHRDMKPGNLHLAEDADGVVPKILDFGIARSVDGSLTPITQSDIAIGTPHYMSPEQVRGVELDHRTDIYAMGVVLYEAFAGRLPFEGPSVSGIIAAIVADSPPPLGSLRPGLAPALIEVVSRAMHRDPAQRYGTAREMREALLDALGLPARVSSVDQTAAIKPSAPEVFMPTMQVGGVEDPEATAPSDGPIPPDALRTDPDREAATSPHAAEATEFDGAPPWRPSPDRPRLDEDDFAGGARRRRALPSWALALVFLVGVGGVFAIRSAMEEPVEAPPPPEVPPPAATVPLVSPPLALEELALRWRGLPAALRAHEIRFASVAGAWQAVAGEDLATDALRALRDGFGRPAGGGDASSVAPAELAVSEVDRPLIPRLRHSRTLLNMRAGPSTRSEILFVIPDGGIVVGLEGEFGGVASELGGTGTWVYGVAGGGKVGWLASSLLVEDEDCLPEFDEGEGDALWARTAWRWEQRPRPAFMVIDEGPPAAPISLRLFRVDGQCGTQPILRRRWRGELESIFISATHPRGEAGESLLVLGVRSANREETLWRAYVGGENEPVWTAPLLTDPNREDRGRVVGSVRSSRGRRGWWPLRYTEGARAPSHFLMWQDGELVLDEPVE